MIRQEKKTRVFFRFLSPEKPGKKHIKTHELLTMAIFGRPYLSQYTISFTKRRVNIVPRVSNYSKSSRIATIDEYLIEISERLQRQKCIFWVLPPTSNPIYSAFNEVTTSIESDSESGRSVLSRTSLVLFIGLIIIAKTGFEVGHCGEIK